MSERWDMSGELLKMWDTFPGEKQQAVPREQDFLSQRTNEGAPGSNSRVWLGLVSFKTSKSVSIL